MLQCATYGTDEGILVPCCGKSRESRTLRTYMIFFPSWLQEADHRMNRRVENEQSLYITSVGFVVSPVVRRARNPTLSYGDDLS